MVNLDEAALRAKFLEIRPALEDWGHVVDEILSEYLKSLGYSMERVQHSPEYRVKDEESFIQKALFRGKNYSDPIKNITDKIGTRVVLLNIADVILVSDFIKKCEEWFVVEQAQDIDYIREHDPTEFKYQSNHFVVKPKPTRYSEELCELLTCEIQVRTLLQHAYAEASHDTVYKKGHSEDPKVIRCLAVTMAFLETADEKIKYVYENTQGALSKKSAMIEFISNKYKEYMPSYKSESLDTGMIDAFWRVLPEKFQEDGLAFLDDFIKNNNEDIQAALSKQKLSVLFQQPVCLLAFYAIRRYQPLIIEKWPFTFDSLKEVLMAMNISEDVLG